MIFCTGLLNKIGEAIIDNKLRQKQAGFRKGRGYRSMLCETSSNRAWNGMFPCIIYFIDFEKAFYTVWKILQSHGVPPKIVSLIKMLYDHFECIALSWTYNTISEWFSMESGVRQGCILSPILFLNRHRLDLEKDHIRSTKRHQMDSFLKFGRSKFRRRPWWCKSIFLNKLM